MPTEIIQLLTHGGVPGAMLIFFMWYLNKRDAEHKEERKEWKTTGDTHVTKFAEVIERNTTALAQMDRSVQSAQCTFKRQQ